MAWLKHASIEDRGDPGKVLYAMADDERAFKYATQELRSDPEFMKQALSKGMWPALQYAAPTLQGDFEVVMAAVSRTWMALQYASKELQNDPEILRAAAKTTNCNTDVLRDAPAALMEDEVFLLQMVAAGDYAALRYASEALRGDLEFMLRALSKNYHAFQFATEELKEDWEKVMRVVSVDGMALKDVSAELQSDHAIVVQAVTQNGNALQFAKGEAAQDRGIVMMAVSQSWDALTGAARDFQADKEIISVALCNCGSPPQALGLHVTLLSGRCCFLLFCIKTPMHMVVQTCAREFKLGEVMWSREPAVRCLLSATWKIGTLFVGTTEILSLKDLEPGQMNEVSLVLS